MHPAILITLVFLACCTNVVTLEFLIRAHPGSGTIVTFCQFLFIAVEGFIFEFKFGTKKSVIPMKNYVVMVSVFFITSSVNNYALNFNISLPLHMIFKSGSLVANMVLGIFILKRSYKMSKYISVAVVTAGIFICSLMSAQEKPQNSKDEETDLSRWFTGIAMLSFSLFASARLGIYQEQTYAQYGKHPKEALFYNHAMPLAGFSLFYHLIYEHAVLYSQSEPVLIPVLEFSVPKLWLILACNVVTQYICVHFIFTLAAECSSLTVTMVCTLRKLFNILFSVYYFNNSFTVYHWFGTFLVFTGSLLFVDAFPEIARALEKAKIKYVPTERKGSETLPPCEQSIK